MLPDHVTFCVVCANSLELPTTSRTRTGILSPITAIVPGSALGSPYNCLLGCPNPPCQQNQVAKIARQQSPFNQPLSSNDRYFTVRNAYAEIMDNPVIMNLGTADDSTIVWLHDSIMFTNVGLMRTVSDSLAAGDTLVPRQLYNAFSPSNTPEQNQKIVYEIYFRTWALAIYDLNQQDYSTLLSVAQQFPDEGGTAVLDARVMLNYRQDDYFSASSSRLALTEPEPDGLGIMYPNPVNEEAYYDITLEENQTGTLELFNAFGQSLGTFQLLSGENHITIDLSKYSSGVYSYRVYIDGVTVESERLIISK
jgi:hypothetical protein